MISIINNPNSRLAYFKQEDYAELLGSGVPKRSLEKKGIQRLLEELGYNSPEISYKETGQPFLTDNPELFLSVSHAQGWFAVLIGTKPLGVDIQTYSPRLILGQDYFRNEREGAFSEDERALHLIWGAKEAFYKLKEGQMNDLKEEVSVFAIGEHSLIIHFEQIAHELKFVILEKAFLVFTS